MARTLTYISIGFCGKLIYADGDPGIDYNMLLMGWGCLHQDRLLRGSLGSARRSWQPIRTLATKVCHNTRQTDWADAASAGFCERISKVAAERMAANKNSGRST